MTVSGGSLGYASFWVDYVYLDTDERRRFAQVSHEYLIEQVQFTGSESVNPGANKIRLNFNHPVKELVWVVIPDVNAAANDSSNYGTIVNGQTVNPLVEAKLQLNGHDRFDTQAGRYFNLVQPYQYHTNIPKSRGINVYSFALKPEEHQPSGSCNFSRIDNATLNLQLQQGMGTGTCNVYAVNYNVLRIMSGMKSHPCQKASCLSRANSHWLVQFIWATFPICGNILPIRKASSTTSERKLSRGTRGNDLGSKNGDVRDDPQSRHLSLSRDKEQDSETRWKWAVSNGLRYSPASWRQDRRYCLSKASTDPLLGWT